MDAKSILGHKISDFNTNETLKFRCIAPGSDLTIYVKEFGLEKFQSSLKMKCFGKYGSCEAQSDNDNTTLTFSPAILSPYFSIHLCPSKHFLPSIIGKYACNLSKHVIAAGDFKYFLGSYLPSINIGLDYKLTYFGSRLQANFVPSEDKYAANVFGDIYVTDEVYRANLSFNIISFPEAIIGLHLSNRNIYLGFLVDNKLRTTAHLFSEFKYRDIIYGIQTSLQKVPEEPFTKKCSVGFRKSTLFGYYGFAFKTPNILSAKIKYFSTDKYELSGTLRVSNFQFDDPHLGVSLCVFPDKQEEINERSISNIYKPLPINHV